MVRDTGKKDGPKKIGPVHSKGVTLADMASPVIDGDEAERMFTLSPDMLCVAGIDGYFKRLNQAWEETLGYTREELLALPFFDLIHPDDRQSTMDEIKNQVEGRATINFVNRYRCKDGSYRLLSWRASPAVEGILYAAARDITKERQAEEAFDAIIKSTMGLVGQELLDSITENLCGWLGADCVIIGEIGSDSRVRARSMMMDGKRVENFEYDLNGTPCEDASKHGFCLFPEGITKLYPEDRILIDFGADGYAGSPLKNRHGRSVGILCAVFRERVEFPPKIKDVFDALSGRAAAEMERLRAEDELKVRLDEIERLNNLMVGRELRIEELKREVAGLKDKVSKLKGDR